MKPHNLLLFFELVILFIALPFVFIYKLLPNFMMLPLLLLVFSYTFFILKKNSILIFVWNIDKKMFFFLLLRVLVIGLLLYGYTLFFKPQNLFYFMQNAPLSWLGIIIFYPFISAFTQEVIFRQFFFFRYTSLWGKHQGITIFLSAFFFSFMHIVFQNFIALGFSFIGGLIFAYVYAKTKNLALVAVEHGLYGDILFTLGLGYYFYHGSV